MTASTTLTPPPPLPPAWLWSCHVCHAAYPLGATRRCLVDGHRFCAGTLTHNKRTGKLRRSTPCGSVFDYVGWRAYGEWRRHELKARLRASDRMSGVSADADATTSPADAAASAGAAAGAGRLARPLNLRRSSALTPGRRSPSPEMETAPAVVSLRGGGAAAAPSTPPRRASDASWKHNCARDCDFPSECRWRPHMTGAGGSAASAVSSGPPTPPFAALPPSPTSPTDPSSPLTAAILHDGFPADEDEDEEEDVADARVGRDGDGDEEIRDACEAVERKGEGLEMPVLGGLKGGERESDIGLAVTMESDADMGECEKEEDSEAEQASASEQGFDNNRLWDWSIGGLSSLGGIGSGRAGEMDGGIR